MAKQDAINKQWCLRLSLFPFGLIKLRVEIFGEKKRGGEEEEEKITYQHGFVLKPPRSVYDLYHVFGDSPSGSSWVILFLLFQEEFYIEYCVRCCHANTVSSLLLSRLRSVWRCFVCTTQKVPTRTVQWAGEAADSGRRLRRTKPKTFCV